MTNASRPLRLDWVDVAKGICIILVVMFHSTLGVEKALGATTALNAVIEWARPFRMPDFFLISGLFLAARIDRPWRSYLDAKVVHFAYFYLLWLHILLALKAPGIIAEVGVGGFAEMYLWSFLDPFGSLWFIYLLAVYFAVAKMLSGVPKALVLAAAAALHVVWPETGVYLADEFANRFVFFYSGYALAPFVFEYAKRVARFPAAPAVAVLGLWAAGNAAAVAGGWAAMRGPDLAFSFFGIAAVVAVSVLLARSGRAGWIEYCGRNSIAIYLAFTLFMGPARFVFLKLGGLPPEAVALVSTMAGLAGALVLERLVRGTRLDFLFVRPAAFRLSAPKRPARSLRAAASPAASLL